MTWGFDDNEVVAPESYEPDFERPEDEENELSGYPEYYAALQRLADTAQREGWSIEKRNKHVAALRQWMRVCSGNAEDLDYDLKSQANDPAPKPSTGFVVVARTGTGKTRRSLTKAELAQRTRLSQIATEIAKLTDGAAKGRLLREAKALIGEHGKWRPWLDSIRMPDRTARHYMAMADMAKAA